MELEKSEKSFWLVVIMHFIPFCSCFGLPRFYTGPTNSALIRLIPIVGGFLAVYDLFLLFTGKYIDGEGKVVRMN
jgi:hypothetical protein